MEELCFESILCFKWTIVWQSQPTVPMTPNGSVEIHSVQLWNDLAPSQFKIKLIFFLFHSESRIGGSSITSQLVKWAAAQWVLGSLSNFLAGAGQVITNLHTSSGFVQKHQSFGSGKQTDPIHFNEKIHNALFSSEETWRRVVHFRSLPLKTCFCQGIIFKN